MQHLGTLVRVCVMYAYARAVIILWFQEAAEKHTYTGNFHVSVLCKFRGVFRMTTVVMDDARDEDNQLTRES
jgi:hypothetical protein